MLITVRSIVVSAALLSAVEGSNLFVVWQDDKPGNNEIFLISSTDGDVKLL